MEGGRIPFLNKTLILFLNSFVYLPNSLARYLFVFVFVLLAGFDSLWGHQKYYLLQDSEIR